MSSNPLYCPKCGQEVDPGLPECPACGVPFVHQQAVAPASPQPAYEPRPPHLADANSKKMTAGLCAVLIGSLGVHKFVLGYNNAGWIYVGVMIAGFLASCLTLFIIPVIALTAPIMGVISLIEGIMYLTKSDEEFYQTYIANRKEWF